MAQCWRKKPYSSESEAQDAARRTSTRLGEPIQAYYDPLCGHFHIGHPKGYKAAQKIVRAQPRRVNPMRRRRRA